MKKLIILLAISTVLFGGINDVKNPNGQPFTLNISYRYELPVNNLKGERILSAKMPLVSWLTINGGYYKDRYYSTRLMHSSQYLIQSELPLTHNVWYIGGELHLPIYKLWEK